MYDVPDILPRLNRIVELAPAGYSYDEHVPSTRSAIANSVTCVYWNFGKNKPSCIVGHLLDELGLLGMIKEPGTYASYLNDAKFLNLPDWILAYFTADAQRFLAGLQNAQDVGTKWAEALTDAVASYRALMAHQSALRLVDTPQGPVPFTTVSTDDAVIQYKPEKIQVQMFNGESWEIEVPVGWGTEPGVSLPMPQKVKKFVAVDPVAVSI